MSSVVKQVYCFIILYHCSGTLPGIHPVNTAALLLLTFFWWPSGTLFNNQIKDMYRSVKSVM